MGAQLSLVGGTDCSSRTRSDSAENCPSSWMFPAIEACESMAAIHLKTLSAASCLGACVLREASRAALLWSIGLSEFSATLKTGETIAGSRSGDA